MTRRTIRDISFVAKGALFRAALVDSSCLAVLLEAISESCHEIIIPFSAKKAA